PDFALPTGGTGAASRLLAAAAGPLGPNKLRGHPVVLNFWASWCTGCIQEAPDLAAIARDYESKGIVFVGLNSQDTRSAADAFVACSLHTSCSGRPARNGTTFRVSAVPPQEHTSDVRAHTGGSGSVARDGIAPSRGWWHCRLGLWPPALDERRRSVHPSAVH